MDILAADVELVVIVRRDCQRHGPDESIFQIGGGGTVGLIRPNLYVTSLAGCQVEAFDNAADAARSGGAGPDDVVIDRVRRGPTALATTHRLPGAARNLSTAARVARAAIRRIVLLVAVDKIGNAIVDGDVIHL